jgi:hypothetical protein
MVRSMNLRFSCKVLFFVKSGWTDACRELRLIVPILVNADCNGNFYAFFVFLCMLAVLGMVYNTAVLLFSLGSACSHLSYSLSKNWNCLFLGSSSNISRLLLTDVKLKVLVGSTFSS